MKEMNLQKVYLLYVNYRKDDACPPWSIQASKMTHMIKLKKQFITIMLL